MCSGHSYDDDTDRLACPACGAATVTVNASVWVMIERDCELDQGRCSGYEYDDQAGAVCRACEHRSTVMAFRGRQRDPCLPQPVRDCIISGQHLRACGDDGFCGACGYQDSEDSLDDDPDGGDTSGDDRTPR